MDLFFKSNIYVLFGLVIYYFFINDKPKDNNQKIVAMYIFITMLAIFNILNIKMMVFIFILCSFLFFEFLLEDRMKNKIIRGLIYKLIDFSYICLIKYHFFYFLFILFLVSDKFHKIFFISEYACIILAIIFLLRLIVKIINSDFEMYTFTEIYNQLSTVSFENYNKLSKNKSEILVFIEDKSFFYRKNDYTYICIDFFKYRFKRISETLNIIVNNKGKKHNLYKYYAFIKYIVKQIIFLLKDIKNYKKYWRGYSTIDMKLFRTIGIKVVTIVF